MSVAAHMVSMTILLGVCKNGLSPMTNPETSQLHSSEELNQTETASGESFDAVFAEYERAHARAPEEGGRQIEGTVVAVSAEQAFLDIGFKVEGVLPVSDAEPLAVGDRVLVSVKGRNEEGYYALSRFKVAQPTDWASLERAFAEGAAIPG
ncbi:MAG: hypothetical protein WBD10_05745, partial [Acidobacteriaceae bacterium]